MSVDVKTAFDKTKHRNLNKANQSRQIPILSQLACMKGYFVKTATLSLPGGHTTSPFPFQRGGWQGGVNTPDEFNTMLEHMLGPIVQEWRCKNIGFTLNGQELFHLLWSDNLIFVANRMNEMQYMMDQINSKLEDNGYTLK